MTNRHTVNTITSDELDHLYKQRDEARQHAATIAAQRDRLRQRMNTLADRWDHALPIDKPYARTLRTEISCAPFDPTGAMTVQEYTERGRHLWAFRCWGTDTCDGWLGLGHHTQTSALLERERHVAEAHGEPKPVSPELREHLAAALIARIKRATISKTQPYDGLTSLLAANEFDLADTAIEALVQRLDIGEEEAWCKTCRRVWDGPRHRCESDAEQRLARAREIHQEACRVARAEAGPHALCSMCDALDQPAEQPARTTPNNPTTSKEQ